MDFVNYCYLFQAVFHVDHLRYDFQLHLFYIINNDKNLIHVTKFDISKFKTIAYKKKKKNGHCIPAVSSLPAGSSFFNSVKSILVSLFGSESSPSANQKLNHHIDN